MTREDCIQIGYIAKAHGVRGEMKAVLDVYDVREYRRKKILYGGKRGAPLSRLELESLRPQQKSDVIVRIKDIGNRDQAAAMIGTTLFIPADELPSLPEGHFYYFQVIGFDVHDETLGKLGTVKDFADGAAHDILIMTYEGREVLIPVIEHIVGRADFETKSLSVNLPEGLLEAYME